MFDEAKDMEDALFDVYVMHGAAAIESGSIENGAGEVAIEA